jgi:hypothetical protein
MHHGFRRDGSSEEKTNLTGKKAANMQTGL